MPDWQIATALSIVLLLGLGTHIFYRRPPSPLWPSLPLAFGAALLFSVGDLIANQWSEQESLREVGMFLAYTGLLCITPSWWVFSCRFSQISGYASICSRFDVRWLIGINAILWVGLLTNPVHGAFFESHPGSRSSYGPLWYFTAAVNYLALVGTVILHTRGAILEKDPTVRSHCRFLVGAILIPLILNMTYVMSPVVLSYDPTALGFAISSAILLYAVRKRGLFSLEQVSLPSLLNTDLDAIVIISRYRRILYANPAAKAFFGSDLLQVGASVDPLFEASATTFSLPEPSQALPITEPSDHFVTSPSGDQKWFVIETSGVIESTGRQVGVCLRLRDQTALRNAHREGARRLGLLEAIGQSSGNGLLVEDESGNITYTNQALRTMWGLSEESIPTHTVQLEQQLSSRIASLPAPHRLFDVETFGSETGSATLSADCTLTDGRILEVQTFRVSTAHGLEGRTWRFIDVTKTRAETQLMIQNQKLEGLGVLADGIAHEFNNLLATIVGNAELIRESLDDDVDSSTSLDELEEAALQASERT
ncbi:PAS domain-containing protein, partial [Myxococcota bacterium]|nr:PAS domain-containing protein [Myxococcota bacterium]